MVYFSSARLRVRLKASGLEMKLLVYSCVTPPFPQTPTPRSAKSGVGVEDAYNDVVSKAMEKQNRWVCKNCNNIDNFNTISPTRFICQIHFCDI